MTAEHEVAAISQWLCEPLPPNVAASLQRLARSDDVKRMAIMPDVHLSHDVCIGTVVATTRLVYPSAVGGDIGCGMAALGLDADANWLGSEQRAAKLLAGLYRPPPDMPKSLELNPPQTIISVPVQTAVCTMRAGGALSVAIGDHASVCGL